MDNALATAAISGGVAITVAALSAILTYVLTQRKERDADWRKVKLDLYRTYVLALSGVVKHNKTPEDQVKYADALNSLTLVASPAVLRVLYAFQDAVAKGDDAVDERFNLLMSALRLDIHPAANEGADAPSFRFMSPPRASSTGSAAR
jgi:hypothetical protein